MLDPIHFEGIYVQKYTHRENGKKGQVVEFTFIRNLIAYLTHRTTIYILFFLKRLQMWTLKFRIPF